MLIHFSHGNLQTRNYYRIYRPINLLRIKKIIIKKHFFLLENKLILLVYLKTIKNHFKFKYSIRGYFTNIKIFFPMYSEILIISITLFELL